MQISHTVSPRTNLGAQLQQFTASYTFRIFLTIIRQLQYTKKDNLNIVHENDTFSASRNLDFSKLGVVEPDTT